MKRGEVPDFSVNQKLGIRSLGAHEQEARRDYQIDNLARRLDIPRTRLRENPTVQRYVSVMRDADVASERLGKYYPKAFMREADPVAYKRTGQASLLYAVEGRMLAEGFHGRTVSINPETANSITTDLDRL